MTATSHPPPATSDPRADTPFARAGSGLSPGRAAGEVAPPAPVDPVAVVRALASGIAARAAAADRGDASLAPDIAALRDAGVLRAALPARFGGLGLACAGPGLAPGAEVLRRLGRANLAVARLFEGHLNAVKLVMLYAGEPTRAQVAAAVAAGALMGVWGADGAAPVRVQADPAGWRLNGVKAYASGLGLVALAVISATDDLGVWLMLAPVDDPARADPAPWRVAGMRATASGAFDTTGLVVAADARIGPADVYYREPHFQGGVWRYAAAQVGGIEALVEAMRQDLARRGRLDDPHQAARFGRAVLAAETARAMVDLAAHAVEAPGAAPGTATRSVLARLAVERAACDAMAEVDRALGASAHFLDHPVERLRRDLGFYIRQANPDGAMADAARAMAALPAPVGDFWEDAP